MQRPIPELQAEEESRIHGPRSRQRYCSRGHFAFLQAGYASVRLSDLLRSASITRGLGWACEGPNPASSNS